MFADTFSDDAEKRAYTAALGHKSHIRKLNVREARALIAIHKLLASTVSRLRELEGGEQS
jgi:hypothetical protein